MKPLQRIPKAIGVAIIVGIGVFQNTNVKNNVVGSFREMAIQYDQDRLEADTVRAGNGEDKLSDYANSIIHTGIQILISKI
ncbi:MAG TPA: hypothetical protein VK152_06900 [Paludibacter sp.]|nr:hypothetical protein [Paludibacter sp.]